MGQLSRPCAYKLYVLSAAPAVFDDAPASGSHQTGDRKVLALFFQKTNDRLLYAKAE